MPDQPPYASYLMPQSATSIIPQQMGQDYLGNLEQTLNLHENQQMNQLLAQQNQMGTLSSGQAQAGLAGIMGDTQNQFANAYTGLVNNASGQANQQQFGQQFEEQGFQDQLKAMQQEAEYQQQLAIMKTQLFAPQRQGSFGNVLGQQFAQSLPDAIFGAGAGAGQGAFQRYMAGGSGGSGVPSSPIPGLGWNSTTPNAQINFDPNQYQSPYGQIPSPFTGGYGQ